MRRATLSLVASLLLAGCVGVSGARPDGSTADAARTDAPRTDAARTDAVADAPVVAPDVPVGTDVPVVVAMDAPVAAPDVPDPVDAASACPTPTITAVRPRGSDTPVNLNATYDYSPSVMLDGVYRMWWCCGSSSGGVSGDHVCYAEAASLDGPWHAHASTAPNTHDEVFHGTGNPADFDGTHTCDPSVVRVDGTYYMYYGAISDPAPSPTWTRIGVASSPDGFTWTRMNGGHAIVDTQRNPYTFGLATYGTGQPSVTYLDGLFYMIRTDISGYATVGSSGQYVLRSADPTFQAGVEMLTATGFVPFDAANSTRYSFVPDYWAGDWQYVDALDAFAVAETASDPAATHVHFYSRTFAPLGDVAIPAVSTEEPALVSRPDRHAVPWAGDCATLALDVIRSVGTPGGPGSWELAHAGIDVATGQTCACAPLGRMLEGTRLAVPATPLTIVRGGVRLQFALGPPAVRLARNEVNPGIDVFNAIPYGASIHSANRAIATTGLPGGYVLDDGRFWPVSCPGELTDNGSSLEFVDAATYSAFPAGPALYCLQ